MESLKEKKNACVNKYLKYDSSLGFVAANDAWDACQKEVERTINDLREQIREYKWEWEQACERERNRQAEVEELADELATKQETIEELEAKVEKQNKEKAQSGEGEKKE
jgi:predicted RNase H-like nuclease (RuvC/YqgF family)